MIIFRDGTDILVQDRHAGTARCGIGIWYDHEALENLQWKHPGLQHSSLWKQ